MDTGAGRHVHLASLCMVAAIVHLVHAISGVTCCSKAQCSPCKHIIILFTAYRPPLLPLSCALACPPHKAVGQCVDVVGVGLSRGMQRHIARCHACLLSIVVGLQCLHHTLRFVAVRVSCSAGMHDT
ncbi:hypothetical protein V8C86DRAFT_877169 [Haematococcus lacustris]